MTIVTLGGRYYIPVANGLQEITHVEAMDLYEKGEISHTEVIEYD
jgi:hypothetical protein